jgi:ABC-2 type transport system permease protein
MSAGTVTVSSPGQSSHRVAALARAEGILLRRNRLALASAALVPVALIGGTAVFVLLAAVTAAVTRTVQLAQVTTMPALWLPLVFSGLLFPLAMLPGPLRWVAEALPLTPVAELMRLALTGAAAGGHRLGLAATFSAKPTSWNSRSPATPDGQVINVLSHI